MFRSLSQGEAQKVLGLRAAPREEILTLQWLKLVNLFGDKLGEAWGGDYLHHGRVSKLKEGLECFIFDTRSSRQERKWLHLEPGALFWEPGSTTLRTRPSPLLGAPYEPYLSCRGGITSMASASTLFGVTEEEFYQLKKHHMIDRYLIQELIQLQLDRSAP